MTENLKMRKQNIENIEKNTRAIEIGENHRFVRFTSIISNLNLSQQSERDL